MTHYDLAILGTGSGNMIVNRRFADWRVAIIEENRFGGTCLNVGCIPTKMFVHPADLAREAADGPRLGVRTGFETADWPAIRDRVFGHVDPSVAAARQQRLEWPGLDVYEDHAVFTGDHTLQVGDTEVTADQIVIAAGGRVQPPDIPGLDEVDFHTSDTVMHLPELPARMVILGGGYVAAEFAHVFSAYGTQVTQVHRGGELLRVQDEEVSARFTEIAQRQWTVRLRTEVGRCRRDGDDIVLALSDGSELRTDVLLVATGRVPNTDRIGLESTSVKTDDSGVIVVDEYQRTSVEGVWALGDIANHHQLKHVANHEARTIAYNLLHPDALRPSDHRFVPSAVFTSPQIATVGLTTQQARDAGLEHRTVVHRYGDVAYGWALEDSDHFVKLVGDRDGSRLLGAHVLGPQASLLIQPLIQGMSLGHTVEEMARGQYWIHPALSEVVENALLRMGRAQ